MIMLADSYSLSQTHTHSHVVILNQVIRSLEEGLAVSTFLYLPSHGLIFLVSLSLFNTPSPSPSICFSLCLLHLRVLPLPEDLPGHAAGPHLGHIVSVVSSKGNGKAQEKVFCQKGFTAPVKPAAQPDVKTNYYFICANRNFHARKPE